MTCIRVINWTSRLLWQSAVAHCENVGQRRSLYLRVLEIANSALFQIFSSQYEQATSSLFLSISSTMVHEIATAVEHPSATLFLFFSLSLHPSHLLCVCRTNSRRQLLLVPSSCCVPKKLFPHFLLPIFPLFLTPLFSLSRCLIPFATASTFSPLGVVRLCFFFFLCSLESRKCISSSVVSLSNRPLPHDCSQARCHVPRILRRQVCQG